MEEPLAPVSRIKNPPTPSFGDLDVGKATRPLISGPNLVRSAGVRFAVILNSKAISIPQKTCYSESSCTEYTRPVEDVGLNEPFPFKCEAQFQLRVKNDIHHAALEVRVSGVFSFDEELR